MKMLLEILRVRKKSVIALAVLLVITVTLVVCLQVWLIPGTAALQVQRNERQRLLSTGGGDISAVYHQGTKDLATFGELVPSRKAFARVVGQLFELAANNNLTVSGVSYKPNHSSTNAVVNYTLSFSVVGKYAGAKSYLADLQRFREMVVIDQFDMAGGKATEENVDLKLNMTIYLRTGAT